MSLSPEGLGAAGICAALLAVAAVAARASLWLADWLGAQGLLDRPNDRSLHQRPIPRGGGIVILAATLLSLPPAVLALGLEARHAGAFLLLVGGSSLLGWLDDRHGLPARLRLAVQGALGLATVWALGLWPAAGHGAPAWLAVLAVPVITVWLTNLYNFMDGADGLAATQGAGAGFAAALLLWQAGAPGLALVAGALAAGSLGFLAGNWPPARLFMGDVGSYCLGSGFAALAVVSSLATPLTPAVWPILLAPFVLDASLTLALRLLRGSHPFRAHREHTYQRLLLSGVPLRRILHGLIVLQLALLWPAAFRAATDEGAALALAAGVLLMGGLAWLGLRRLVAPAAGAAPRG